MIHYIQNINILDAKTDAIVNPVNCQGVMGAGLARAIRDKYHNTSMFYEYRKACANKELDMGRVSVYELESGFPRFIVQYPTKNSWRDQSTLEGILSAIPSLGVEVFRNNIESIAIPKLGCGLGGLDWEMVKPELELAIRMDEFFDDVIVEIFE